MEGIILLFIMVVVINAINRSKRGARTPARGRGSVPDPFPFKTVRTVPAAREAEHYLQELAGKDEASPVKTKALPWSFPTGREGDEEIVPEEIRGREDDPVVLAGEGAKPVDPPTKGPRHLFNTRDDLLALFVFHELLQPPLSRRR